VSFHTLATDQNGHEIIVNLTSHGSAAALQISEQPHLLTLAKEILEKVTVQGNEQLIEKDMGRTIGSNFMVETTSADTILYAQQLKQEWYTRYVKNRSARDTTFLTLDLQRVNATTYELIDIFMGRTRPAVPGHPDESATSKGYWATHAVIWGSQKIRSNTITKDCPWQSSLVRADKG
jgi:hypothetical protein